MAKKKSKLSQIEQLRILQDITHAAYRIVETLYDNDDIQDSEAVWRLNVIAGFLFMVGAEIETAIIVIGEENDLPKLQSSND